jgi:3-oxoacyl-[acyl-carrier-protein] synthase III
MPNVHFSKSKIIGISACVPEKIVHNKDYTWIDENERKQLIEVTGIKQRRVAGENVTTSDMCFVAAEKLIKQLDLDLSQIGFLVFVTQSRDYYLPQTSAILQHRLGLPQSCMSFDVAMGCSGYTYGLSMLSGLLEHSDSKFGLLLAGDVSTRTTPFTDKSTHPLFGDTGTATLMEKCNDSSTSYFNFGNDGGRHEAIIIRNGYFRNGFPVGSFDNTIVSQGIERSKMDLELNGADVFHFSITDVPANMKKLLKTTGMTNDDIDFFILHQANKLILQTIGKILKIPQEKIPINIDRYGNTSVGSIPLCMVTELRNQLQTKKLKLFITGFGVGLSWGSALIETENICIPELQYISS